MRREK